MKLVLLPGMDGTGLMFRPFVDVACNHSTDVISYPNDTSQKYTELIDFVKDRLPREVEFIIIAESFSGPIAYALMKEVIPNLKAVIFVASFLENPRPILLSLLKLLPISLIFRLPIPKAVIRKYMLGFNASDSLIAEFKAALSTISPTVLASRLKEIVDLKKPDKTVNHPCCYIMAADDKLVTSKSVQEFKRFIPNIHIRYVNGPHFLLQSEPKECLKVIDEEIINMTSRLQGCRR